jgi:3-phenylpropionate/trans-cinnamate dioxygenase ferredoxin reductase component
MSVPPPIVIIGAGHAGVQAAATLREEGVEEPIYLVGEEAHIPYERPPLSKSFVRGATDVDSIKLRDASFFQRARIELVLDERATALDLGARRLTFSRRNPIHYSHLILATGSANRRLPFDTSVGGVHSLRSLDDAMAIRERLKCATSVVVIGAGFIGMEFAASALAEGRSVTVVEPAARPLGRSATPTMAEFVLAQFGALGVRFHFGARLVALEQVGGKVSGVKLSNGLTIGADMVLIGVGAVACDALARDAGLPCPNGIEVDAMMGTADPHVSAIGDCSWHPNSFAGSMIRLESVQNAGDQARTVAKRLAGKRTPYEDVPWFWSDLGDNRLQIAGLLDKAEQLVTRGVPSEGRFSLYGFSGGALVGVESLNRPGDHLLARRLLAARVAVTPAMAADASFELKQLLKPAHAS